MAKKKQQKKHWRKWDEMMMCNLVEIGALSFIDLIKIQESFLLKYVPFLRKYVPFLRKYVPLLRALV